ASALASEPSVQCKTILSIFAPTWREEQFGLRMNCLMTGFASDTGRLTGVAVAAFALFAGFVGFTGIARSAEIVILTTSSVCNPSADANPGDKSATRPVAIFGPQSTGRASAARPFEGFSTRASARFKNSFGVSL